MAMRMRMFKTPKHRKYNYTPRFYNPEKEDLQERLEKARAMSTDDVEGAKARIAYHMNRRTTMRAKASQRRSAFLRSAMLMLAIVIVLLIGAYFALEIYLPKLLQNWAK